ncbi:MAG TPA: ABC transporter permease [Ktedonobacterales bacterium]|nr:ABC transporter permease [Ktedonobacterales bacterium]
MATFFSLVRANFLMVMRQRALIISSLGLAVISVLVFGFLFSDNGAARTQLGIVDEDHTPVSAQLVSQLQHNDSFTVYTGSADEEQQALKDGNRDAVLIIPAGFNEQLMQGGAHLQVLYNQSNPVTAATTKLAVSAIVDGINRSATHQPGPVTLDEQGVASKNLRTIDYVAPGMIGMLLMWANLTVAVQLVFWREEGITKRLAATPLAPIAMISGQLLARLLLSIVQEVVLIALAIWLFNIQIYGNWGLLALVIVLGALTMLAIGFAVAGFFKKSQAANAGILLVSFPMMFLGGSYFPVSQISGVLGGIIHALPLYYLNDALRQIVNNGSGWAAIQTSVLVLVAWIVASMLITWRAFRWQ